MSEQQRRRRRKRARGHIKQTRDGVFKVVVPLGRDPRTGKPRRQCATVYGDAKAAEKKLTAMLKTVDDEKAVARHGMTVNEAIDAWERVHVVGNPDLRINTIVSYRSSAKRLRLFLGSLGGKPIQKFTRADTLSVLSKLRAARKRGTVAMTAQILANVFEYGVDTGLLVENHVRALMGKPRMGRGRATTAHAGGGVPCLTAEQVAALLSAAQAESTFLHAFIALGLATGARLAELLALRHGDINVKTGRVNIERQVLRAPRKQPDGSYGEALYGPPKSRGQRSVAVNAATIAIVERHLAAQRKTRMAASVYHAPKKASDALVFAREEQHLTEGEPDALGLATPAWLVRTAFQRCAKAAGLTTRRVHALRHWTATTLLASGVPVGDVAERLGHTPQVLLQTYTHSTGRAEAGVAELGKILHG